VNTTNDRAIFLDNTPLVRKGDVAFAGGATGLRYAQLWTYTLNDDADVAFMAAVGGTGVSEANDRALFKGYRGSVSAFAREGDPAPGAPAGVRYGTFFNAPALNDARDVGYVAALVGEGVTASNDRAVFAGSTERPRMVARTGDQAPGTPDGFTFRGFQEPALAAGGGVFLADLAGPGAGAANDLGLFSFDYRRGLSLIVREGGVVNLGTAGSRIVADGGIGFVAGHSNGMPSGLDGGDRLVFSLRFTDGSSGVFTVAVPEPSCSAALMAAGLLLRRRREGQAVLG
jgi:hypothetical protein